MNRNRLRRSLLVFWVVSLLAVVGLTLWPSEALVESGRGGLDKLQHVAAYAWLCLVPTAVLRDMGRVRLAVLGLMAFGAVLELLQGLAPFRTPSLMDELANILGCLSGYALGMRLRERLEAPSAGAGAGGG